MATAKAKPITANTRWQTWVIYGESGVGKSTLAATAPRPVYLDSNQGLLSIADVKGLEHVRGIDVFGLDELQTAYDNCSGTGDEDWSKKFNTVVFDHFDDIQGLVLDQLGDKVAERGRDADEIDQRMYGIMGNKMRRLLRLFKKIPMHKILICGEARDFETGALRPSLVGALKHQLPYFADHVAYLRTGKKGVRYLHLDPTEDYVAKTRAHWLTPEQRKIRVSPNDRTTLTNLFALIAAGPKGTSTQTATQAPTTSTSKARK